MSHFAEINSDGVVQRVIVAEQNFINSGSGVVIIRYKFQ